MKKFVLFFGLFLLLAFLLLICTRQIEIMIPFAGPTGRPKLENVSWKSLEITYWIVLQDEEKEFSDVERTVSVSERQAEKLRSYFRTQTSRGWALGNPYPSKLETAMGSWHFRFSAPTSLEISRMSNTDYGYLVDLVNDEFYEQLKTTCLNNEKTERPDILPENIRLVYYRGKDEKLIPYQEKPLEPTGENAKEASEL